MSDFSNLLSQLQQSAKAQSHAQSKSHKTNSSQHLGKHDRQPRSSQNDEHTEYLRKDNDKDGAGKKQKINSYEKLPRDHKDLSIKISFLCIGAQKAGTTWLHEMLQQNPSICLPRYQKELHFWDWNRSKGLSWYSRQFPSSFSLSKKTISSPSLYYGEITPCYAVLPSHDINEISRLFPNLKIVFFARNLLERTWSAMLMELYQNVAGLEAGEFANHDKADSKRYDRKKQQLLEKAHPKNYKDDYFLERMEYSTHSKRTDYAKCIRNWLKVFPKEAILIVDYRNVSKQPKSVLETVCRHIMTQENCGDGRKDKENVDDNIDSYLNTLTKEHYTKRINAAVSDGSSSAKYPIPSSLERKMKKSLRPMAEDFNDLLKELGYDWSIEDFSDCT